MENAEAVGKSSFESAIAGLELVFPAYKGHFPWARAVIAGRNSRHVAKHAVPMGLRLGGLLGAHLASAGVPRLGAFLIFQAATGIRPGEGLGPGGFVADDVAVSTEAASGRPMGVVRLGVWARGTKAKREQFVILRES